MASGAIAGNQTCIGTSARFSGAAIGSRGAGSRSNCCSWSNRSERTVPMCSRPIANAASCPGECVQQLRAGPVPLTCSVVRFRNRVARCDASWRCRKKANRDDSDTDAPRRQVRRWLSVSGGSSPAARVPEVDPDHAEALYREQRAQTERSASRVCRLAINR